MEPAKDTVNYQRLGNYIYLTFKRLSQSSMETEEFWTTIARRTIEHYRIVYVNPSQSSEQFEARKEEP